MRTVTVFLLAAVFVLAGCGGKSGSTTGPTVIQKCQTVGGNGGPAAGGHVGDTHVTQNCPKDSFNAPPAEE